MKTLDCWINGLMDYWGRPVGLIRLHPFIHPSNSPLIHISKFAYGTLN